MGCVLGSVGVMHLEADDLAAVEVQDSDTDRTSDPHSAKFDRLAAKLGASSLDAKAALRTRFESDAARVHEYRTRAVVAPIPWGPSRMDAIGLIVNRLTATASGIPENWSPPLAPTKPPFLWNAPQGSWTQWRGVQQDPISRNLIETMGVFMSMDLVSKTPADGLFDSNAAIADLDQVEKALQRLAPPQWPENVFGKIDRTKAAEGKASSSACARAATMPGPTPGPSRTNTASASSWSGWFRRHPWGPTPDSSMISGHTQSRVS
jgi:hypothetical protein